MFVRTLSPTSRLHFIKPLEQIWLIVSSRPRTFDEVFNSGMAVPKQQGISLKCDNFIRTRRINQTQSFLLQERLKILDSKKTQRNAEFDEKKHSLQKQMEEIKTVKKNHGMSVERRKLLRSQGFTIDARASQCSGDDTVAIKKYSTPEITRAKSPRPSRSSSMSSNQFTRGFSQPNVQENGVVEKEIANKEVLKDQTNGPAQSRARHQFRVIEPPCRPGSRRNFVQISCDKLMELKKKEDKKSRETLFDPSLKVDHRGMIVSSRLVKSLRKNNSQFQVDEREDTLVIKQPNDSSEICVSKKQICQGKQTKDPAYKLRPSSVEIISLFSEEQVCTKNHDLKVRSKSCESLDRIAEVRGAPDSCSDCHATTSSYLIRSGNSQDDHKSTADKLERPIHSAAEPRRKHASYESMSPVRLAFVESQNGTTSIDNCVCNKQSFPKSECDAAVDLHDRHTGDVNTESEKSTKLQRKVGPVRRVTLPLGIYKVAHNHDLAKGHDDRNRETKRLSVASHSPNVPKSKITAVSSQPERLLSESAVSYAYDARPERSLCKGYITMQMTVNGKQVKVNIPKFPHDADSEPVFERAKKKVAEDRLQSKMPLVNTETTPKEDKADN